MTIFVNLFDSCLALPLYYCRLKITVIFSDSRSIVTIRECLRVKPKLEVNQNSHAILFRQTQAPPKLPRFAQNKISFSCRHLPHYTITAEDTNNCSLILPINNADVTRGVINAWIYSQ